MLSYEIKRFLFPWYLTKYPIFENSQNRVSSLRNYFHIFLKICLQHAKSCLQEQKFYCLESKPYPLTNPNQRCENAEGELCQYHTEKCLFSNHLLRLQTSISKSCHIWKIFFHICFTPATLFHPSISLLSKNISSKQKLLRKFFYPSCLRFQKCENCKVGFNNILRKS